MCRNFRSVFCKKSLNMGPIFHEKINFGSDFQNCEDLVFLLQNHQKKKWVLFSRKSLHVVTYFWKHYPWTWVWVLSCRRHIPDQSKSDYTHPQLNLWLSTIHYPFETIIMKDNDDTKYFSQASFSFVSVLVQLSKLPGLGQTDMTSF